MLEKRRKLGEILHRANLVKTWDIINAINTSTRSDKRLGEILVERGQIDEDILARCIAVQFGLGYVDLDEAFIPPDTLSLIPEEIMRKERVIPIGMSEHTLRLIVSDPTDQELIDTLRFCMDADVACYPASPAKIRGFLDEAFGPIEISGKPMCNAISAIDAHDCGGSALRNTGTAERIFQDTRRVEIEDGTETQTPTEVAAEMGRASRPSVRANYRKIIRRVMASSSRPHFKRCKSCWIENRIPTGHLDDCLPCARCGNLIRVQPSALMLIFVSVILLLAFAGLICAIALTPSLLG